LEGEFFSDSRLSVSLSLSACSFSFRDFEAEKANFDRTCCWVEHSDFCFDFLSAIQTVGLFKDCAEILCVLRLVLGFSGQSSFLVVKEKGLVFAGVQSGGF
jgi:hypothetical protein